MRSTGFAFLALGSLLSAFLILQAPPVLGFSVTQVVQASPVGGASVQVITANGCGATPTGFPGDAATHSLSATGSCVITLVLPLGYIWVSSSNTTVSFTTCLNGVCPGFFALYEPLPNTCLQTFSDNGLKVSYGTYAGSYLKFAPSLQGGCLQAATYSSQWANFTAFSLSSPFNPSQSFAVGVQGGNETLNVIASNYVEFVANFSAPPLLHFQYVMPPGSATPYPPQVQVRGASSSTTIPFASYKTTGGAFAGCAAPCVFINQSNQTVIVKVPAPSTEAIDIFFFVSGVSYTVQTTPVNLGSSLTVDGVTYNSPQVFFWSVGSVHILTAISPTNMAVSPYTSFSFVSWSDGGSQTHSVVAPSSSTTYSAKYSQSSSSAVCGSPNPLQQLERGCIVPALLSAWSASIGLPPWLGFVLLATNVAIYNKTQSVFLSLTVMWVTGAVFSLFLPPYVGLIAQVFLYLGAAGIVVRGILLVR